MKMKKATFKFETLDILSMKKVTGGETVPQIEDDTQENPQTGKPITIK